MVSEAEAPTKPTCNFAASIYLYLISLLSSQTKIQSGMAILCKTFYIQQINIIVSNYSLRPSLVLLKLFLFTSSTYYKPE